MLWSLTHLGFLHRYLAQLLEGKEPTQLRPGSAAKVLEMLNRIKKVVTDGSVREHMQYLQKLPVSYLLEGSKVRREKQQWLDFRWSLK